MRWWECLHFDKTHQLCRKYDKPCKQTLCKWIKTTEQSKEKFMTCPECGNDTYYGRCKRCSSK